MNRANQVVGKFGERLRKQYGFLADPSLPLWKNIRNRVREMTTDEIEISQLGNMACHNLLQHLPMPPGTKQLLGLGLNYCLKGPSITTTTNSTFDRLRKDLRRMYHLRVTDSGNYIKGLYIKSEYKFKPASDEIEEAIDNFEKALKAEQLEINRRRKPSRNVTFGQWELIQFFRTDTQYTISNADKNCGPYITERAYYTKRGCTEHLANTRNYQQLSQRMANAKHLGLLRIFDQWLGIYGHRDPKDPPVDYVTISEAEDTFLRRARTLHLTDKLARFRMTAKVHKSPWKMRPIVCCVGTLMNDWSRWLDYWLKQLKCHVPTYVKDSQEVLDQIKDLTLPPNAYLFTTDANAMYNNISTEHAIEVITWWLDDLAEKLLLPDGFPLEAVLYAMKIIMRNNIFEFGDCYFLQLLGTAMGTSAAVMWATLYYAYHEVHTLLPRHGSSLLYFRRFIDDIFGIWVGNTTTDWSNFCNDVDNFGVLTWDIKQQRLSTSVDFLDLTLSIENCRIVSRTFQKDINLYLYIPPLSAHMGCIKGTIFGLIRRYYAQNTYRHDFVHFCRLLYRRLLARGWERDFLRPLFMEACNIVSCKSSVNAAPTSAANDDENRLFLHLEYHPDDVSRSRIQELYQQHLGEVLLDELGIPRPTIAYHRPKNIGDFVSRAKLVQASGQETTTIMGEVRAELASL